MFAPIMTKWYQLLNRLQFRTPTRAVVYRARPFRFAARTCIDHRLVPSVCGLFQVYLDQSFFSPIAVAFFFGSMSVLEGKGLGEAADRVSHVRLEGFGALSPDWLLIIHTALFMG